MSCGARLAPFDIAELREVTAYDELELDTLGDKKTALFLIMSDTDDSFNFLISNGQKVDSRIYPYLQEMFDDARSQGIYPFVREGYRTTEEQRAIFDERIQEYIDAGNSEKAARELTEKWVAVPGTSEHQLGISVDINADVSKSTSEDVYKWLAENAYQYGFILRYPQGKEDITGTAYEPWHYRYVGLEAAKEIYEHGICLEEYVQTDLPAS